MGNQTEAREKELNVLAFRQSALFLCEGHGCCQEAMVNIVLYAVFAFFFCSTQRFFVSIGL